MKPFDRYSAADAPCGSLRKGTTAVLMGFAYVDQAVPDLELKALSGIA